MAGGVGSRFWPLSTPEYPKQFIDILGCGRTLIQLTVDRFKDVAPIENFWVVTNAKYVDIVKAQIPGIPANHILAEPEARNTAPCIAWACWKIKTEDEYLTGHQQEGEEDPQHVHKPLSLVPDQRDVGHAQGCGKDQQEGRGQ